jgi:alpha-ketoglutarate-dependent 2,4-dichlorophenoxyacetate dioxygenase
LDKVAKESQTMTIEIEQLTPIFGARITGIDVRDPLDKATITAIDRAIDDYSILHLPGQPVTDDEQVAFTEQFGPLEETLPGAVGSGSKVARMSNYLPDGTMKDPDSQKALFTRANNFWHTDSSFNPAPARASMLSARKIATTGGDTEFASTRAAYDALSEEMRAKVEGLIAYHDIAHSRLKLSPNAVTALQRQKMPPVPQAMVRVNPMTGRKSLLIGSHISRIEGMADDEAEALNEELVAIATRPENTYRHIWSPNDIFIWDNRAALHRGLPYDEVNDRRLMIRTTLAGAGPTVVDGRIQLGA